MNLSLLIVSISPQPIAVSTIYRPVNKNDLARPPHYANKVLNIIILTDQLCLNDNSHLSIEPRYELIPPIFVTFVYPND